MATGGGTQNALAGAPGAAPACKPLARVVLVTGKGGVGKTTVAAGLAVAAAAQGAGAVLVEFGDGLSGRRALGKRPRRVEHLALAPVQAVVRAATPLFHSRVLTGLVLGNFAMRPLVRAAPAVREMGMLEAVRQIAAAHPKRRIVVDMPAAGHCVAWLRLPQQAREAIDRGPLHEMCDRVVRELLSPGMVSIAVVTLPERLVLRETRELCRALRREVGLDIDRLVVNRMPAPLPEQALEEARELAGRGGDLGPDAAELARILEVRRATRAEALAALSEIMGHGAEPLVLLPLAAADPDAVTVAAWLQERGAA
ncbi:MAG: hypothetical protein HY744_26740 [Deltaproteobacteria bacterium]|nr:hypothetical protein [Deltaproteobacteria bacterium]